MTRARQIKTWPLAAGGSAAGDGHGRCETALALRFQRSCPANGRPASLGIRSSGAQSLDRTARLSDLDAPCYQIISPGRSPSRRELPHPSTTRAPLKLSSGRECRIKPRLRRGASPGWRACRCSSNELPASPGLCICIHGASGRREASLPSRNDQPLVPPPRWSTSIV